MKKWRQSSGFTLLEVLIALTVLALAFISVFSAISYNSKIFYQLQDKTAANWVALNILAEVQMGLINPKEELDPALRKEKMLGQVWYWTMIINEAPLNSLPQIEITVRKSLNSAPLIKLIGFFKT